MRNEIAKNRKIQIWIILLILGHTTVVHSQLVALPIIFNTKIEISGISKFNNEFFLVSEKQSKIFSLYPRERADSFEITRTIMDPAFQNSEFEAIATYKKYLLITDEKNPQIFAYNLETSTLLPQPLKITGFDITNDRNFFGLEGIAINEKKKICYLLKERNQNFESEIRQFAITENIDGTISLEFKRNLIIKNDVISKNPEDNWRYSDIHFDERSNLLYGIKASYIDGKGEYYIDTIKCDVQSGLIGKSTVEKNESMHFMCLTKLINDSFARSEYSTNLEGIVISEGFIYVVSDNFQSSPRDDGKKTLLLKIRMSDPPSCN